MGSDMCQRHFSNLNELLTKFEQAPKEVQGLRATTWFQIGEDIFRELFQIGCSVEWQLYEIKNYIEVSDIYPLIEKNKDWLESFITLYPNFRIDLDLVGSADNVCQVRSGIDVLMNGFKDINSHFDSILQDLSEKGEVDEFDRCLKLWLETGHRPEFLEKISKIPEEHWWWF